jgi:hypothetical protein
MANCYEAYDHKRAEYFYHQHGFNIQHFLLDFLLGLFTLVLKEHSAFWLCTHLAKRLKSLHILSEVFDPTRLLMPAILSKVVLKIRIEHKLIAQIGLSRAKILVFSVRCDSEIDQG